MRQKFTSMVFHLKPSIPWWRRRKTVGQKIRWNGLLWSIKLHSSITCIFTYSKIHVNLKRNHMRQLHALTTLNSWCTYDNSATLQVSVCFFVSWFFLKSGHSHHHPVPFRSNIHLSQQKHRVVARWWNECPWWPCWEFSANTSPKSHWLSIWTELLKSCRPVKVAVRSLIEGKNHLQLEGSRISEISRSGCEIFGETENNHVTGFFWTWICLHLLT